MKTPGDTITEMVNAKLIEEVDEGAVSDRSHLVSDQMLVSIAISMKRLADQGDRIATSLETLAGELAHPEWGVAPTIRRGQQG